MSTGLRIADQVAQVSIDLYGTLRHHGKPTIRPNGVEEWTILASISLVFPPTPTFSPYTYPHSSSSESLPSSQPSGDEGVGSVRVIPVALGTGVKVLPANKLPPLGDAVHDSHAEVLARRGFNRWLIEEGKKASEYEQSRTTTSGSCTTTESGESGTAWKRRRGKRGKGKKGGVSSIENTPETISRALPRVRQDDVPDTADAVRGAPDLVAGAKVEPNLLSNDDVDNVDNFRESTVRKEKEGDGLAATAPRRVPGSLGWKDDSTDGPERKKNRRKKKRLTAKKGGESSSEWSPLSGHSPLPGTARLDPADHPVPTPSVAHIVLADQPNVGLGKERRNSVKTVTFDLDEMRNGAEPRLIGDHQSGQEKVSAESGSESRRRGRRPRKRAPRAAEPVSEPTETSKLLRLARSRRPRNARPIAQEEIYLVWEDGKLRLKDGVEVWLYVSTLPCGDASMLHTAVHQDPEVANQRASSPPLTPQIELAHADDDSLEKSSPITPTAPTLAHAVRGRNGYDNFGAIRTKPGRADSTPTISLSCSDKIAGWTVLGLQGALLEDLFEPIYLSGVVVGGVEEVPPDRWAGRPGKTWRQVIAKEVERALWGRLGPLIGRLPPPFDLHPPAIFLTDVEFPHSKTAITAQAKTELEPAPSTLSLSYVPVLMRKGPEVLYNGTRQSSTWKAPGTDLMRPKARATTCKIETMRAYIQLMELVQTAGLRENITLPDAETTYHDLKHRFESPYQRAKTLIRGLPVTADTLHSAFGTIGPFDITFTPDSEFSTAVPPFSGWIVSGKRFESFTRDAEILLPPELYPRLPEPAPPKSAPASGTVNADIAIRLGMSMAPPLTPPPEILGLEGLDRVANLSLDATPRAIPVAGEDAGEDAIARA